MNPVDRKRYGRQMRLSEVGPSGQAKLCAAQVVLCSAGFGRHIEERYVRAAGIQVVEGAASPSETPARPAELEALGLRHAPAREVAEGAFSALLSFRAALGL